MNAAAMIYSVRTFPRWLRQAAGGVDAELATLCRRHWQKLRQSANPSGARELRIHALEPVQVLSRR